MKTRSELKNAVYQLKRDYGKPIDLYEHSSVTDIETGKKVITRKKIHINLAAVLPSLEQTGGRLLSQTGLTGTGVRQTGGYTELTTKIVVIDEKDLPPRYDIALSQYIIIDFQRFDIISVKAIDFGGGYLLNVIQTKDAELSQIVDVYGNDHLIIKDSVEHEGP